MKNIIGWLGILILFSMWIFLIIYLHLEDIKKDDLIKTQQIEIEQLKSKPKIPTTVFTITRNNMQVVSSLGSDQDTFTKHHHYKLKDGVNSDYIVLQEGQSFEWKIINY